MAGVCTGPSALGGRVHDPAAEKRFEDSQSQAGMRGPARLAESWPSLWQAMAKVTPVLLEARGGEGTFAYLTGCVGEAPARQPPTELEMAGLRAKVANALGLSAKTAEQRHPAAPWRFQLVAAIQDACGDPDTALRGWLEHGAPMGIAAPIAP